MEMTRLDKLLKQIGAVLGLVSVCFFVFDYLVFSKLQPVMVSFETVAPVQAGWLNWVGISWLLFLVLCLLTGFCLAERLRRLEKVSVVLLLLLSAVVLGFLSVFSSLALLSDIGKQYSYGLAQPEWSLIYPITAFQLLLALIFSYFHLSGFKQVKQVKQTVANSNTFLMVDWVGLICGLIGLAGSSLGFCFPKAWNLASHVTASLIILLIPYGLVAGYWLAIRFGQGQDRKDNQRLQDAGRSACLALVLSVVFMTSLFIFNYSNLDGVIRIIWLPLYLFFVLLVFSGGNLYFSQRD